MITVFVVEDDEVFGKLIVTKLKDEDFEVSLFKSGEELFENLSESPDIIILDYQLPGKNGLEILEEIQKHDPNIANIVFSGQEKLEVVIEAYNYGAKHYIIKNSNAFVELANSVRNLSSTIRLRQEVKNLRSQIIDRNKYSRIIGDSPELMKVLKLVQKVEDTSMLAMITGESGTGKELIANALHYNSSRKRKSFVTVNIAAIPEDLLESELFGHEKGAFTGASGKRIGKFEEANNGSIFLDEIGELDLGTQVKLLRVLQENKITRLGSNKEIRLNIRVIAATNKNLGELVKEGKFREDLYYRLQGFLIQLPPLRARDNDVVLLAKSFLKNFCEKNKMEVKQLSPDAVRELLNYDWPGNIRELKSLIERSVLVSENIQIYPEDMVFSEPVF